MSAPAVPWFAWGILAWFALDVVLDLDVGLIPLLIVAFFASSLLGRRRPGTAAPQGGQGAAPVDRPGPVLTGELPPPSDPMPTIDVPTYPASGMPQGWSGASAPGTGGPGAGAGGTAYPPAPTGLSTDPAVSLGQLHLGRLARELETAAGTGDRAEVARLVDEVGEVSRRTQQLVEGASGTDGSGRREFGAGLRRLQREAAAARAEDPPGARVAALVRGARAMGQTGRYE